MVFRFGCHLSHGNGDLVVSGVEEGGLYRVNRPEKSFLAGRIELWHRRLGHLHEGGLKKLKRIANGVDFQDGSLAGCVACFEAFKSFKAKVERQTGKKLKILRTDNGKEYVNESFRKVLEQDGIKHQTTCPYTHEQNGAAERMNMLRCMLNDATLGKELWAEAISTATHVVNRCPARALENKRRKKHGPATS